VELCLTMKQATSDALWEDPPESDEGEQLGT
jgi:hypothetical protein